MIAMVIITAGAMVNMAAAVAIEASSNSDCISSTALTDSISNGGCGSCGDMNISGSSGMTMAAALVMTTGGRAVGGLTQQPIAIQYHCNTVAIINK